MRKIWSWTIAIAFALAITVPNLGWAGRPAIVKIYIVESGSLYRLTYVLLIYEKIVCRGDAPRACPIGVGGRSIAWGDALDENPRVASLQEAVATRVAQGQYHGRLIIRYSGPMPPIERIVQVEAMANALVRSPQEDNPQIRERISEVLDGYDVGIAVWKYDPDRARFLAVIIVTQ